MITLIFSRHTLCASSLDFLHFGTFFSYVTTQFGYTIKSVQCDNSSTCSFFLTHGVLLQMSCPYTSQNGKVECIISSVNNIMCSLLFQASLPASYWVEGLHTATYLLNRLPTKTLECYSSFRLVWLTSLLFPTLGLWLCLLS